MRLLVHLRVKSCYKDVEVETQVMLQRYQGQRLKQ
jgi:hypothetical protein